MDNPADDHAFANLDLEMQLLTKQHSQNCVLVIFIAWIDMVYKNIEC